MQNLGGMVCGGATWAKAIDAAACFNEVLVMNTLFVVLVALVCVLQPNGSCNRLLSVETGYRAHHHQTKTLCQRHNVPDPRR